MKPAQCIRNVLVLAAVLGSPVVAQDLEQIEIVVDDFTFDARAAGPADGELVLLLHGFPETSFMWRHQLGALADAGYRAVAPNQRGYSPGARPPEVADYNTTALSDDVAAIAGALGHDRFHLVGHDWGGAVAWIVAMRFRDRLHSLTVLSTPHPTALGTARANPDSEQGEMSSYFAEFATPGTEHSFVADDARRLRQLYSGFDPEAIAENVRVLGTPEAMRAALAWYGAAFGGGGPDPTAPAAPTPPITTPTLYIWSTDDTALGRDAAEATRDFVTGPYIFQVLEGVDHWITERAPEAVSRLVLAHVEGN